VSLLRGPDGCIVEEGGSTQMAKGQVKVNKGNKPKLSTAEKQKKKQEKKAAKGK
jgi:hypothetical protein